MYPLRPEKSPARAPTPSRLAPTPLQTITSRNSGLVVRATTERKCTRPRGGALEASRVARNAAAAASQPRTATVAPAAVAAIVQVWIGTPQRAPDGLHCAWVT